MTKQQKISELILIQIAETGSVKAGFDKVMGEGVFEKMAGEIYEALKTKWVK